MLFVLFVLFQGVRPSSYLDISSSEGLGKVLSLWTTKVTTSLSRTSELGLTRAILSCFIVTHRKI